ncbi:MAG TPA: PAS domain S-box protein, partial [Chthoniobacterales bacterium]|nr:PAS domain S-box protein [Chthoniobacterales bacterium]
VPGDNGKITHFVSVKQDATERRKAALKLQTSEKQYRKLFEGNPNPMWVYDSETLAFLAVNHAAVHKYGYSEQEFLSMTIKDIRPPEDIPALMRDLSQNNGVLQSGSQWRHRKKDGELIDVEMSSHQSDWLGRRARLVLINDITERKRAEDALNASRQLIEGILNAIPISVFWKDENLNYLGGNRQFAQDAGFNDPKDIIGKNDYQMGWRDNADLYRRDDREVIESGCAKLLIEEPQTTPEGNIITLLTSKVPLRDSKGEISGVIGAYLDITERKRMEAQRDRLAALVEASPDFIGFADPKTERIQYINKNGRRMCGIGENEDLTALDVRDLHPAWMNQKIAEVVFPTAIQHGLWEGEGAFLHRSGGEVPVSMALMARKDATGEVDLFYTVSRDISEHKRAARVLRDANERFEIVTRATTNVIWDWDLTNNSIWWNDHFHVVFGYPAEEAGTALESWTSRIHPDDLQRVHHKIFEVINSAELKWSDEYRFRRHNGEYACVMDRGHVLRDEQGKAFRMIGAMEDITQRKEAAAKLRHAHDQLEKRVIERTADLEQARAAAEKANQSKSEFLSRMSHELRTPLNAILGFAQLLELDGLQSQSAESVDQILKGGHHLLDLINEVLDIARIETGNGRLSVEPVSVREVIEEARALLGQYPTNHSIKIDICPSCLEDLFVMADRQRLKQVLLNLLSNAVKYNRDGGSVLVTCEMSSEDLLRINVRDTGLGIPPDKIEEAFIPFKRLHTQTCEAEGTGLGLSLSRQLIQAMGGRIGATSAVNEGSNFWIELPLAQKTAESAADDFKYTNLPELEGRARTILYIEDNLSNLKLIERVLESRKNIKLLSVMQGSMGISMAREHQPDLILLDLGLPDIPGEEVLSRLKSDPKIHKIPVVVLSADATQKQIDRLLSLGAIRYLTKPLNLRSFVDALIQQFKEAQ